MLISNGYLTTEATTNGHATQGSAIPYGRRKRVKGIDSMSPRNVNKLDNLNKSRTLLIRVHRTEKKRQRYPSTRVRLIKLQKKIIIIINPLQFTWTRENRPVKRLPFN